MLGLPEKKVRKVVQIVSHEGRLYALRDDGTIWFWAYGEWLSHIDVPQGDE
jgi:hypothetical protein